MVTLALRADAVIVTPTGWSKLWTLCRRLRIPREAIREVRKAPPDVVRGWKGWRLPGTSLPGVITAGHYRRRGHWEFWDVRGSGKKAIEIVIDRGRYRRIVVDVDSPTDAIERLRTFIIPTRTGP